MFEFKRKTCSKCGKRIKNRKGLHLGFKCSKCGYIWRPVKNE